MMKFACGECGQRFSTTDDPAPGHVYGVPCRCGTTIIVHLEARAPVPPPLPPRRARPAESAPRASDDPFARAAMDAVPQEPLLPATETVPPPLLPRDPDFAERDASEGSSSLEAWPETTRARWLAGTRAMLLDATAALREILGAGARQLSRRQRLAAGGATLGAIAFGLGLWVGSAATVSRWKAQAMAETEARTPPTSRVTVASLEPVAVPVPLRTAAAVPALDEVLFAAHPAAGAEASRGRSPHRVEPAGIRHAAIERPAGEIGPTTDRAGASSRDAAAATPAAIEAPPVERPKATGEPAKLEAPGDGPAPARGAAPEESPAPPADRVPQVPEPAMTGTTEGRVEPASEPTLTAALSPAPEAESETNTKPAAPEPKEALPGK